MPCNLSFYQPNHLLKNLSQTFQKHSNTISVCFLNLFVTYWHIKCLRSLLIPKIQPVCPRLWSTLVLSCLLFLLPISCSLPAYSEPNWESHSCISQCLSCPSFLLDHDLCPCHNPLSPLSKYFNWPILSLLTSTSFFLLPFLSCRKPYTNLTTIILWPTPFHWNKIL